MRAGQASSRMEPGLALPGLPAARSWRPLAPTGPCGLTPGPRPRRPPRADMRLRELSLRGDPDLRDPDLRQELAALARGCDLVLPSRFKRRLKAFRQVRRWTDRPETRCHLGDG